MRPLRRSLALAVPAALAALVVSAVPAASAAPAAAPSHVKTATAPQAKDVVQIIHRGFVKDCEYIKSDSSNYYIEGNGVNKPVSLTVGPGSCFNLYNEFSVKYYDPVTGKDETSTGYQYQDLSGHCLWQNDTSKELELGVACNSSDTSEDFYALYDSYHVYGGWQVSDKYGGSGITMGMTASSCPAAGENVYMEPTEDLFFACDLWNFPS
jgi:hypothetical protein